MARTTQMRGISAGLAVGAIAVTAYSVRRARFASLHPIRAPEYSSYSGCRSGGNVFTLTIGSDKYSVSIPVRHAQFRTRKKESPPDDANPSLHLSPFTSTNASAQRNCTPSHWCTYQRTVTSVLDCIANLFVSCIILWRTNEEPSVLHTDGSIPGLPDPISCSSAI